MAWTNALSQVISDEFSVGPVGISKLPFLANTTWSDVAESNDQVTIVTVGDASVGTYTPGNDISWGTGAAGKAVLTCDKLDYFADELDDSVKLVGAYATAYGQKALQTMVLKADANVLALATKANFPTNWYAGAADAAIDVNGANIIEVLEDIYALLSAQEVPEEGRFIALPPTLVKKVKIGIRKAGLSVEKSSDSFFEGKAIKVAGMNIVETNQIVAAAGVHTCLFGHADAIAVAYKMPAIESVRRESRFATGIKALMRHGAKVVQEKMGGAAKLKAVAEA